MRDPSYINIIRMWSVAEDEVDAWKSRMWSMQRRFEEILESSTDGNARAIAKNASNEIAGWTKEQGHRISAHAFAADLLEADK